MPLVAAPLSPLSTLLEMGRRSHSVDVTPPAVPTVALAPKRHAHCPLIDLCRGAMIALYMLGVFNGSGVGVCFAPEGLGDATMMRRVFVCVALGGQLATVGCFSNVTIA